MFSSLLRYKIAFRVTNPQTLQTDITYTVSLPEIAGKKITLSYIPATGADAQIIQSYLPTGSSITISSLPTSLPAYLINMKPQLLVDGQAVAAGSSIGLGNSELLTMTFTDAHQYSDIATTNLTSGEYYGIAIDAGGISQHQLLALKAKLETTKANLFAHNFTGMTRDDILGDILYTTAISYYAEYDMMDQIQARGMGIVIARVPSEIISSVTMNVRYMFGVPTSVSIGGLKMDVQRNLELTQASDGDNGKVIQYMLASGLNSSELESSLPEQLFSTPEEPAHGISAVKVIQIANDQGIPIYTVNQSNISAVLPQLQLPSDVISDIQDAINAGKIVTVPKTDISYNGWTGVGYIIIDPTTGAGAYMISGGLGGAIIMVAVMLGILILMVINIAAEAAIVIFGVVLIALMPLYWQLINWLAAEATEAQRKCAFIITVSAYHFIELITLLAENPLALASPLGTVLRVEIIKETDELARECF